LNRRVRAERHTEAAEKTHLALGNRRPLPTGISQRCTQNGRYVIRRAHIRCASLQGRGPHFFVGDTMGADDADSREIPRQMLDLREWRGFNIQNGHLGAVFGDAISQFVQRLDLLYGKKSLGQRGDQRLRNSRIALEENNGKRLHTSLRRLLLHAVGPGRGYLRLDGASVIVVGSNDSA